MEIQLVSIRLKIQAVSIVCKGSEVNATGTNGYEFESSALSTLSRAGTQTLQIAAYDGKAWETGLILTTKVVPVLSASNQSLKAYNISNGGDRRLNKTLHVQIYKNWKIFESYKAKILSLLVTLGNELSNYVITDIIFSK